MAMLKVTPTAATMLWRSLARSSVEEMPSNSRNAMADQGW
jgi:hypothetical protein